MGMGLALWQSEAAEVGTVKGSGSSNEAERMGSASTGGLGRGLGNMWNCRTAVNGHGRDPYAICLCGITKTVFRGRINRNW